MTAPIRRTKIVATLGPASSGDDVLRRLIRAGVDVFRLNFSHGSAEEHRMTIRRVRSLAREAGTEVAVLQDLCGPKIRVGRFTHGGADLEAGRDTVLTTQAVEGSAGYFSVQYDRLPADVRPGARILLNDGRIELIVEGVADDEIRCRIVRGGPLTNHQGVNLPDTVVSVPSVTEKDLADLEVGMDEGVDFIALSFVRHPDDLAPVRERLAHRQSTAQVLAKIEKAEAVEHIDGIVARADGILVARGDLGVEMDLASVAVLQKDIVRKANEQDKYVIVATQMLESMIRHASPTRAEVSDVTNAILDGADALMLSGETAIGVAPVQTVTTMAGIARTTERFIEQHRPPWDWHRLNAVHPIQDAIGHAAADLCRELDACAIVAFSATGGTGLFLSKSRPPAPMIVFTAAPDAMRRMRLFWGVTPLHTNRVTAKEQLLTEARSYLREHNLAEEGDRLLLVAGTLFGQVGSTNSIDVAVV